MTMRVVVVNACNRSGDVLLIKNGDKEVRRLFRGECYNLQGDRRDTYSFQVDHGIDDDYLGNPVVTVTDPPASQRK